MQFLLGWGGDGSVSKVLVKTFVLSLESIKTKKEKKKARSGFMELIILEWENSQVDLWNSLASVDPGSTQALEEVTPACPLAARTSAYAHVYCLHLEPQTL